MASRVTLVGLVLAALLAVCSATAAAATAAASVPVPAAVCGPLSAPQHGAVSIRNSTRVGEATLATFSCALGRQLEGERTAACRRSGHWSHAPPRCTSVGLRAFPDRAGLATVGTLPVHSPHLIWALSDVAQRKHAAVGFTMELRGAHRVTLLRQPPNATMDLLPSAHHDTFLFTRQGTLKRHAGMRSTPVADLEQVEFATNPAVLKGLRAATLERRAADPNVVGFSVATGLDFQVGLLGWNSLPLRSSKAHHSFVLRAEVDEAVVERGCFKAGPNGEPALRSVSPMPKGTTVRSARLVCAAIARDKSHRFAAISGSDCFSGNNAPDRYGKVAEGTCAVTFKRAAELKASLPADAAAQLVVGAGAPRGFFHSFKLSRSLLPPTLLSNGGFEHPEVLDASIPSAGNVAAPDGKRDVVLGAANSPRLEDWSIDNSEGGEVGLATWGSAVLTNHTVAEGKQVLFISGAGAVAQQLNGLRVGKRYTLKFVESFRKDQAPGMTLRVQLGDAYIIYQNPFVSVPLWSRRTVSFRATAATMKISFIASDSRVVKSAQTGVRPLATLLIDDISVSRRARFATVKAGKAGQANHGRVATIDTSAPELIAAFAKVARRTAKRGEGGLGFRVVDNIVSTLGVNDLRLKASPGALIVLNNGTTIKDFTTRSHSGHMSVRHPSVLGAISRIARRVANSVGFSVGQDMRKGVRVFVLAPAAMPLQADAAFNTYLFDDGVTDLGCWALPPNGANILRTVHTIHNGPVTKTSCAMAAASADHSYFALQNGNQCVSGRNNPDDQSDDLYYSSGRSARCSLRCKGDKNDICGGVGAANVFRLPLYSRVSRHGHASVSPLRLSKQARELAQVVFDEPGVATFSTANPADLSAAREAAAAVASEADKPTNAAKVAPWAHPLQYRFSGSQRYAVTRYVIQAPTLTQDHELTPSAWTFEGSHDGRNWTVLDRQSRVAFYTGQHRSFSLRHSQAFHFHRLVVTDNGGAGCAGFGVQGVELLARREKVRFLKALYRFDDPANIGHDSSVKANDLRLFGGVVNGTDADLMSVFNVTTDKDSVRFGKGSLHIANRFGGKPSWLALDEQKRVPDGVPVRGRSFGVAFWFKVDALDLEERFGGSVDRPDLPAGGFSVLAWGDSLSRAPASNRVSLDRDFAAVRNSFHGVRAGRHGLATPAPKGNQSSLLDAWHHYAVSYDQVSGAHRVWLDGKLVAARLYQNPRFSVTPERFVLGLSTQGGNGTRSDEFNGLLDDVAIFNGPLSGGAVREIVAGSFGAYMPPGCQAMSDEHGVEAGVTWGRATRPVKERYLRLKCFTKPTDCQQLSDRFDLSPVSEGRAGYYASKQYRRQQCATWPSVIVKADTFAVCAVNQSTTVNDVATAERAISVCHQLGARCRSFVWGGATGDAASGIKAQQLLACTGYLSDLRQARGVQIVTRVGSYLLHPDSKIRCDSQSLPTHRNVPSSLHARWLCDATPGCAAYVWSGTRGEHSVSVRHVRKATPNRLILCAATRKGRVLPYAGSGYEVGEKLGAYLALADRQAPCSAVSALAIVNNTRSSLEAQRECDRMDGKSGVPRCASYQWNRALNQTRLCSSVPQQAVRAADDVELGLRKPESCQEMSDSFGVAYGETWGAAPFEIKQMFQSQRCTTKPRTCIELSEAYKLSPDVTPAVASLVPGTVRDLWLRAGCRTRPEVKESKYLISATFADLQAQVDRLAARAAQIDARIATPNPALSADEQTALHAQLKAAKAVMQRQLDAIREQQAAELAGVLQQPAQSDATLSQTRLIHDIAAGLFKNSLP